MSVMVFRQDISRDIGPAGAVYYCYVFNVACRNDTRYFGKWVTVNMQEASDLFGMGRKVQERARKELFDSGYVEFRRHGLPAVLQGRIIK